MKANVILAGLPEGATRAREAKILDAVRAGLAMPIRWAPSHTQLGYLSAEPCLTIVLPSAENFPWARPDVRPEGEVRWRDETSG
jgi:hypothetical protein